MIRHIENQIAQRRSFTALSKSKQRAAQARSQVNDACGIDVSAVRK